MCGHLCCHSVLEGQMAPQCSDYLEIMWAKKLTTRNKTKNNNNVPEFLTLMHPARLHTVDIRQALESPFSTHNPGYASRSFPLYTFLSRGGYFYILTLGNHDESFQKKSILGQMKPVSASATSVATHKQRETLPLFILKLQVEVIHAIHRCDSAEFTVALVWQDLVWPLHTKTNAEAHGPANRSIQFTSYNGLKLENTHTQTVSMRDWWTLSKILQKGHDTFCKHVPKYRIV